MVRLNDCREKPLDSTTEVLRIQRSLLYKRRCKLSSSTKEMEEVYVVEMDIEVHDEEVKTSACWT
jgi:hypothetical protein